MSRLTRRTLLITGGAALARPAYAARRPRIVMLLWRGWEEACDGFRDYLAAKGIEAEYIVRDAEQKPAAVPGLVADIKRIRPDLVFVWGSTTALAALGRHDAPDRSAFLTDIPAVLGIVTDPLGSGVVADLERPGRPVTGAIYVAPISVQVNAMRAYRPFSRVATFHNATEPSSYVAVEQLGALARRDGYTLIQEPVPIVDGQPSSDGIAAAVARFKAAGAEWLYIPPDTFLSNARAVLTEAALEQRLPAFSSTERAVTYAQALAGLVCRYYNIGQFAGYKAEQILNGTPAGSIPIEMPTRFNLLVRMKTAAQLDFYPPLSLLRYAEAV